MVMYFLRKHTGTAYAGWYLRQKPVGGSKAGGLPTLPFPLSLPSPFPFPRSSEGEVPRLPPPYKYHPGRTCYRLALRPPVAGPRRVEVYNIYRRISALNSSKIIESRGRIGQEREREKKTRGQSRCSRCHCTS